MEDPIQNLLSSMGWSCDDLLEKLQQYKNLSKANVNSKDSNQSSHENAKEGSSQTSNSVETSTTSGNAQEVCAKENAPSDIVSDKKSVVNDSVPSKIDTKVPACPQNGVKTVADNLETKTNDSSDKCNGNSAIIEILSDESRDKSNSADASLQKEKDVKNAADAKTNNRPKNEGNLIISLLDDDDSAPLEIENKSSKSCDLKKSEQKPKYKEIPIISLVEDDDTETVVNDKNEHIEPENKRDVKELETDKNTKHEDDAIICLMEDDDKNENSDSQNEQNEKQIETDKNTKEEKTAITSLMESDDNATFKDINETSESEIEKLVKELETDQNKEHRKVPIISLMEDDDNATFENKIEYSKLENKNDVNDATETVQNTKNEEVSIISLMEDGDNATFENKIENSKSENKNNVNDATETVQNIKNKEVSIISLMEDDDNMTFENKIENSKSENKNNVNDATETVQNIKNEEVSIISLMGDDDNATFENKIENSKSENKNNVNDATETVQNIKNEEVSIISLMEKDDNATFENEIENSKSKNKNSVNDATETVQNIKNEEVSIISLLEDDDNAAFENKIKNSESGNKNSVNDATETVQNIKNEEVSIISLLEDDDNAAFENKIENSKSENKTNVNEATKTVQNIKNEDVSIISLMEDDDNAASENKIENSKWENKTNVNEATETVQNIKNEEVSIFSLMEEDEVNTFGDEKQKFEIKNDIKEEETPKETETAIISLIEDSTVKSEDAIVKSEDSTVKNEDATVKSEDSTAKSEDATVKSEDTTEKNEQEIVNVAETLTEESNDSVFLKPTATVKEFTEAKKSEASQEAEECEPEPEPQKNEEEVRNMLRMQILQLRNKKKVDVISSPLDKDLLTRKVPELKKKKRKLSSDDEKEEATPPAKKVAIEEDSNKKDDLHSVLLSNESEFLIVDVIGGYKSPEPEQEKEPQPEQQQPITETPTTKIINEHLEGEPMHLSKTSNYKNIKGWQRKKFIVPIDDEKPPKKAPVFDEAVPSCSFEQPATQPQGVIKSAFESNLLDAFLVENAQLNISYEVPKLHAEGSITHDDLLVPVRSFDANLEKVAENAEGKRFYKPKTLAEKRKMLQRIEQKKEKEREEKKTEKVESSPDFFVSKMYCRGKIIKVRTRVPYGGYLYYMTKKGISKGSRKLSKKPYYVPKAVREADKIPKPSLLTCLRTPEVDKVCYKPGPLSMKRKLQDQDSTSAWTTVIKKLPKITLQVFPEFRKPVDPRILSYLQFDEVVLTEKRVDFALAALKSGGQQRKGFTFDVAYKNDEKFMLFRQQRPQSSAKAITSPPEEDDKTAVKIVMDKLLNYLEISEIADDLIKPDPEQRTTEASNVVKPLPPMNNRIDAIIKSTRKRRTSLELRRLNVKIIDVDVAEKDDKVVCFKPFCKLGCVCKSLECGKTYNFHCGNQECMLDCKCNYSKIRHADARVILPAGTDLLSVGTVSHLQKQAKRNLAKVEKEFVQTVIQSNDRTIILGTGCRDRQRRATKLPRKMSDYIPLNNIDEEGDKKAQEVEKRPYKRKHKAEAKKPKCIVKMERLDLSDVIPFCLVHELYDCHCDFKAPYPAAEPIPEPKSKEASPERSLEAVEAIQPTETPQKSKETTPELEIVKPRSSSPDHCARTKPVLTKKYKLRNAALGYLDSLRRVLAQKERLFPSPARTIHVPLIFSTEPPLPQPPPPFPQVISLPQPPPPPLPQLPSLPQPPPPPPPEQPQSTTHKRKQTLELRDDGAAVADHGVEIISIRKEKAMQRRKKKVSIGSGGAMEVVPVEGLGLGEETALGEQQPRSLVEELGRCLGQESQEKVHLLSWQTLISGYKSKKLQLWCNLRAKKMIITTTLVRPNKTYMNVNFLQHCVCNKEEIDIDIVRCLIMNKVPKDKDPKEVLLVLTFNDSSSKTTYYEVRGICEKSNASNKNSLSLIKSDLNEDVPTSAETFVHKTMQNELKLIPLARQVFKDRLLSYHRKSAVALNSQPVIQVPLPDIKPNEQWCMVSIMRKFAYLRFSDIDYSIKRLDVGELTDLARSWQQTFILEAQHLNQKNPQFQKNIYVVPTHKDRIFVGPYQKTEQARIETLDYAHGVLVNTDLYCKMKGETALCCTWLSQIYNHDPSEATLEANQRSVLKTNMKLPDLVVIDDDDDQQAGKTQGEGEKPPPATEPAAENPKTAEEAEDDDVVLVKDKECLRQLKRYFVTNVRGLGYIEGTQLPQSKVIDVKWPLLNTIQRYSKIEDALLGVSRQLSRVLIPRPVGFKIKVSVVDRVDSTMVPFQLEYGQGHYAVGEFGVCNLLKTPPHALPFPGGLTKEISELVQTTSRKMEFRMCLKFAENFTPSIHNECFRSTESIVTMGRTEIKYQEQAAERFNREKIALELKRLELYERVNALRKELGVGEDFWKEIANGEENGKEIAKGEAAAAAEKENGEGIAKGEETGKKIANGEATAAAEKPKGEVLIEISDDEDDKKQQQAGAAPKKMIQVEKMPKLAPPAKLVPPLIKITKTSAKEGSKLILSPLKTPASLFKTQRSLVKVPVAGVLTKAPLGGAQKFVLVRDATDPELIKRLKINSGLQVSLADNNNSKETPTTTTNAETTNKETPLQVQTCEIVTVKENNGVKCVSLKRRIPVTELQYLVKKQMCAANKNGETPVKQQCLSDC